jgi:bifunctional UDP-N-acetylglucosamine pyrophosphorylase / glucosamine-1-phosphate N-acetyltransferase
MPPAPIAVVLAAGKGTRMGSDLPKVLHEAAGKPLVTWVLEALAAAGVSDRIIVVGYSAALVEKALATDPPDCRRPVVIVCGDSPMLRPDSVSGLLRQFADRGASCLLGTAVTDDPTGLGRIVRDAGGRFEKIVEQKDATESQRAIREVNMSTYVFEARDLLRALAELKPDNAAGEYYITDCPGMLLRSGHVVDAVACLDASETLSVNNPEQLAAVAAALKNRAGAVKVKP